MTRDQFLNLQALLSSELTVKRTKAVETSGVNCSRPKMITPKWLFCVHLEPSTDLKTPRWTSSRSTCWRTPTTRRTSSGPRPGFSSPTCLGRAPEFWPRRPTCTTGTCWPSRPSTHFRLFSWSWPTRTSQTRQEIRLKLFPELWVCYFWSCVIFLPLLWSWLAHSCASVFQLLSLNHLWTT